MLGGSGIGKSTAAAGLYSAMKIRGNNVELVREYVKSWAWQDRKVEQYDQLYIFGKQARSEYMLYDKVDYIVTDSPTVLAPVYEAFYNDGFSMTEEAAIKLLAKAKRNGVQHVNFVLKRCKAFNSIGRYETEDQAKEVDSLVMDFLHKHHLTYFHVDVEEKDRVNYMLNFIDTWKQ